ncbi:MAG TPA: MM0924 family protein [Pyrinomonadaceae bacterium]|nr:MM0924 family protein [Pyrinomonadaceae bacterium]
MEEFLTQLMGKRIDISCGASAIVRGDVMAVKDGILYLRDEDERVAYVAVEKISIVWEVKEHQTRPGFVG